MVFRFRRFGRVYGYAQGHSGASEGNLARKVFRQTGKKPQITPCTWKTPDWVNPGVKVEKFTGLVQFRKWRTLGNRLFLSSCHACNRRSFFAGEHCGTLWSPRCNQVRFDTGH